MTAVVSALAVEPRAAEEYVRCRLAAALRRLADNPTSRTAHAIARTALAEHAEYERLTESGGAR